MSDDNADNASGTSASQPQTENIPAKLMEHAKSNKVDVAMWATRLLTIFYALLYMVPIFSTQHSAFNKVLLANAATSALRLHQRLPAFTISREYFTRLIAEDSCHYLLFSMILYNTSPTIFILIPISLFAVLHASSYSLKLLDLVGQNSWWGARFLISLVELQAMNILKAVAFSEIFIFPLTVMMTFTGRAGLMTPFVYYHFLVMRYSSRRNPYTRSAFAELRMGTETMASRSPPIVARVLRTIIAFTSRLAPIPQPVPPNQ